ncbi:helix-turn-helix domain-containing protein [Nocardia sp. NBC_00508]|uniref:sigma-54-dependent Fis family transcriptional regulator n=1 Tax=Nocardia sp. NBC_00508 TaxID=2975992 RepID=UPI002E80366A|nr:helix-turn-helix domain-containing protein [Nocardia sp. NBC_00508]WUD65048.1 helix-turn-helix domain-containing protein [Nocardia sp. NBC_00508]
MPDPRAESPVSLEKAREQFLTAGSPDRPRVRDTVLDSWYRSRALQIHSDRVELPYVRDPNLDSPLVNAASPVLRRLASDLADQSVSVILTSSDGLLLERHESDATIMRTLDGVQLAPGYSYAEDFVGTNGIGTTLETATPTFIRGGEHYLGTLGRLACAGSPIRHPMTGSMIGVIDLTCWASRSDPLMLALANSASSQIQDRLGALASETETALLEAYRRQCRRYPLGVLAIGRDVVLMNQFLRHALNTHDQAALLQYSADLGRPGAVDTVLAPLPSGRIARVTAVERISIRNSLNMVLHVQLATDRVVQHPVVHGTPALPGVAGRSSSWRRSCQQIERCCRDREWVVIDGEKGSGRTKLAESVVAYVTPGTMARVLRMADFADTASLLAALRTKTSDSDFSVVITEMDRLPAESINPIANILQACAGRGWIAATTHSATSTTALDSVQPLFTHTVGVPALRHRIEDLEDLVPFLLRELAKGTDIRLAPDAMRQLGKLSWPGNVAELRRVLAKTVSRQRSGLIHVDNLPPECRSLTRRKLSRIEALERDAIVRSLAENGGNKTEAAAALGMSRATIYRRIKDFGIE